MTDSLPPAPTVPAHDAKRRSGPRRATAPAGPPATASAPAVLVLGESAQPVEPDVRFAPNPDPTPAPEPAAAPAPAPAPAPAAVTSAPEQQRAPSLRRASRPEIAETHKRRRGRWMWLPRLLALLVLFAVVVAIGSVVTVPQAPLPAVSASEQSRRTALESVTALSGSASALAATATTAAQQAAFTSAATTLKKQESALTPAQPATPSATHSSAPASSSATPASTPPSAVDSSTFLAQLTSSGNDAVATAQTSPGPMARLLLSVGTGQLLAADQVATSLGVPAPAHSTQKSTSSASATATSSAATPTATAPVSACTTTHQPASGANVESALAAAATAEQEAVYAYQVAATRMTTTTESQQATDFLAQHQQAYQAAVGALRARCISVPEITPGYQLSQDFTQKPTAAVGTLETQLESIYATIVAYTPAATSSDSTRTWVSTQYAQALTRAIAWGAPQSSLPGVEEPS